MKDGRRLANQARRLLAEIGGEAQPPPDAWDVELKRWYDTVERYGTRVDYWRSECEHRVPLTRDPLVLRRANDEHEAQHRTERLDIRPVVGRRDVAEWQDGTAPPVLRGSAL